MAEIGEAVPNVPSHPGTAQMITIRHERPTDVAPRDALLDCAFGKARFAKTCERLREGRLPAEGLSFVASECNLLVGTVRLWHVSAGPRRPALLLGPLAVDPDYRGRGLGAALMERALHDARQLGHREILLVGDEPYYARFGFSAARTRSLWLPGPCERRRLLGLALVPEANDEGTGLVYATGVRRRNGHVPDMVRRPCHELRKGSLALSLQQ
jgi:predicted N-acetyltransferase YhbS